MFKGLNAELHPICHLLALLGAHHMFRVSGLRVNEASIFSTDFQEMIKINQNPSSWSRLGRQRDGQTDRQTDRYDEANSRFSQF